MIEPRPSTEEGATAVEYGILVALIAAVIVGVVIVLGGQVTQGFCDTSAAIAEADNLDEAAAGADDGC